MNTANLETNKPDLNWEEDCNDIPFILCTPTKNEDDAAAAQAQDTTADEKDTPNPMTFFLKPRRSCHCTSCHHQKDDQDSFADMHGDFPLRNDMGIDSAGEECMDLDCSSWSSPVPTMQSLEIIVTPPAIKLPKRRRRASHQEQQEVAASALQTAGLLFPILGRQGDCHVQRQQQQQLPDVIFCRPIPRRHR